MTHRFVVALRGWLFVLIVALQTAGAAAQSSPLLDAGALEALFRRAEQLLDQPQVDQSVLEAQRGLVADQRTLLRALSTQDSVEARALQAQLDALGPPPADGSSEAATVTQRRQELQDAIAKANAPVLAAREALNRAEVIVQELDTRIRQSGAQELLRRFPLPFAPSSWSIAWGELGTLASAIGKGVSDQIARPDGRAHLVSALPLAMLLLGFGLVLIFFVEPSLSRRLMDAASVASTQARRLALRAAANLVLLVLPGLGMLALIVILPVLQLVPPSPPGLIATLVAIGAIMVVANWLAVTLFAGVPPTRPAAHPSFARLTRLLGVAIALELLVEVLSENSGTSDATTSVLTLPVVAFSAFVLWRMADVVLLARGQHEVVPAHGPDAGLTRFLTRSMQVAALLALVTALLGYVNLARAAIVPILLTLALIGLAVFMYRSALGLISAARSQGSGEDAFAGSLIPVGIIFVLSLALLPVLAIVWGARLSDVGEVWQRLTNGVVVGDMRLSLDGLIILVLVLLVGVLVTRWLQRILRLTVLPRTRLDAGAQSALNKGVGYLGITLSALLAVSAAGLNLSNLAVVVGALSVGIGLGLQNIVSNFVSGIILLVERPIKEGDWIEVSGKTGIVRKIAVRSTRIETFDCHDVIVPNLDLISGTVTNFTLTSPTGRLVVPIGVAYGSDVEVARDLILGLAQGHPSVLADPAPTVLFTDMGESALHLQLTCFVDDESRGPVIRSDLLFAIHSGLRKAGIEIPFPQRDIRLRDIDALVKALRPS